jgi:uncharacterized protein (TIGR03083 family)
VDNSRYLELLETDGHLLRVAATGNLDKAVPACPGWTVRDAVEHTAEVYEHKIACIQLGGARPDPWPPIWSSARDPLVWFDAAHASLLENLRTADPTGPSWTWWPADQSVGFWIRRMVQETAIHRVDVQSATDGVTPIDTELAIDGIDEVLVMMLAGDWTDDPQPGSSGIVVVNAGHRAWRVEFSPTEIKVDQVADKSATQVTGEPSPLLLWLWGRAPDSSVRFAGDIDVAHRLRERLALATQ